MLMEKYPLLYPAKCRCVTGFFVVDNPATLTPSVIADQLIVNQFRPVLGGGPRVSRSAPGEVWTDGWAIVEVYSTKKHDIKI
jgi:hypothetical protein